MRRPLGIALAACTLVLLGGCAAAVVGGAATGAAVAHDRRTAGAFVDDEAIEWKVLDRLGDDAELGRGTHINATSYNGVVLLTGEVPSERLRDKAKRLAAGVDGVREVHDELAVAVPSSLGSRSNDTFITSKVKSALVKEDASLAGHTKVVTEDGTVYLMGIVSRQEAHAATEIARRVSGVERVVKVFEYTD